MSADMTEAVSRILRHVDVTDHGCWQWDSLDTHGYGKTSHDNKTVTAHLWVWRTLNGPVPDGLQLDHLCRNRACCNPRHLEPVTASDNITRGYVARNAYWCERHDRPKERGGDGKLRCRPCRAESARRLRSAKAAILGGDA